MNKKEQQKIVITGGPGTGKTSVIKELENRDFFCFHEVIREITHKAKEAIGSTNFDTNPIALVDDSLSFNKKILDGRIQHYKDAENIDLSVVFFDRGIPDVLGYMDFFKQSYDSSFTKPCRKYVYDIIFTLPPWEEIYIQDNERFESYEEALQIHLFLEKVYEQFGYQLVSVPFGTISERVDFILNTIKLA